MKGVIFTSKYGQNNKPLFNISAEVPCFLCQHGGQRYKQCISRGNLSFNKHLVIFPQNRVTFWNLGIHLWFKRDPSATWAVHFSCTTLTQFPVNTLTPFQKALTAFKVAPAYQPIMLSTSSWQKLRSHSALSQRDHNRRQTNFSITQRIGLITGLKIESTADCDGTEPCGWNDHAGMFLNELWLNRKDHLIQSSPDGFITQWEL